LDTVFPRTTGLDTVLPRTAGGLNFPGGAGVFLPTLGVGLGVAVDAEVLAPATCAVGVAAAAEGAAFDGGVGFEPELVLVVFVVVLVVPVVGLVPVVVVPVVPAQWSSFTPPL
jgi:hypothetical protein